MALTGTRAAYVTFRIGVRVQQILPPHRKGTVRFVQGSGVYARVFVNLDGWHVTSFGPSELQVII